MNIFSKIRERIRNEREDGIALITLIGVSMIVFVILGTITTSATLSVYNTNMDLSQKQARNNAESALDIAEASYESAISYYGFDEEIGYDTRNFCQHGYETADYSFKFYSTDRSAMPTSVDTPGMRPGCPTLDDTWYMIEGKGKGNNNRTSTLTRTYKNFDYDRKFTLGNSVLTAGNVVFEGSQNTSIGQSLGINTTPTFIALNTSCNTPDSYETSIHANGMILSTTGDIDDCTVFGDAIFNNTPDGEVDVRGDTCIPGVETSETTQFSEMPECNTFNLPYLFPIIYPNYLDYNIDENIDNPTHAVSNLSNQGNIRDILKNLIEGNSDRIIDARNIPQFDSHFGGTYNVKSDIVLVLNGDEDYNIRDVVVKSDGQNGSLSIVTPYSTSNPNIIFNNVRYEDSASGMFYIPNNGDIRLQGVKLNGSVLLGSGSTLRFTGTEDNTLNYYPVGLPLNTDSTAKDLMDDYYYSPDWLHSTPSVRVN